MRCQEVRRRLAELSLGRDTHAYDADTQAHIAGCPACAQHVQAHGELALALRGVSMSDHTDGAPLSAVRSLVEERVAQIQNENRWSTIMSRIARSFTRPAYLVPTVVAVVAVLALTLFPWKADSPGAYKVAFAGVDKDLAVQQFGVQLVLERLGINGANVELGDCDASCNVTIRDLQNEADVGKVVSAMFQLSDCELLEVVREGDSHLSDAGKNEFVFGDPSTAACCEFVNQLSPDDLEKIDVVVREVRFGDEGTAEWTSDDGKTIQLMAIKNCSLPCGPGDVAGDSMMFTFDVCGGTRVDLAGGNVVRFGDEPAEFELDPLSKSTSSGPISGFELNQNYPNPFNASTTITFNAPEGGGSVSLAVYNVRGQLVKTLVDRNVEAGPHEFTWDATDSRGNHVASGIYLYRLRAGDYVETKKMSLLK